MKWSIVVLLPFVALSAGCAAHSYCSKPAAYEKAASVPVVTPPAGLAVKASANAFLIPASPQDPVPFGTLVKNTKTGSSEWQCLDQPPAFTPGTTTRITEATPTGPIK